VARLVPTFGPDACFDPLGVEGRPRLLEGLARALAIAAEPDGVLILEDLHWFDASSVEVVFHLCQRASALGIRVVATARPLELPASSAQNLVDSLERAGLCEILELLPLSEEDVLDLLRHTHPDEATAHFARRLHRATAGNPTY
jgi:predicted ATPase